MSYERQIMDIKNQTYDHKRQLGKNIGAGGGEGRNNIHFFVVLLIEINRWNN